MKRRFPPATSGGNAKQRRVVRRRWQHFLRERYKLDPGWHRLTREEAEQAFEIEAALKCIEGNIEEKLLALMTSGRIAYTDEGIAKIEDAVRKALEESKLPPIHEVVITGTLRI